MKVFISWSGDLSKNIAEVLKQWLPGVIQAVRPYYSPDDITKGTRWSSEISKELDASKVGLICLTKDNLKSPWIMFEAGALSKNLDKSKVCPLLFGIEPSDIEGPLVQFQAAKFSKSEMKKVVKMMNTELADSGLSTEVLDSVFEMWWPKLEEKINAELSKAAAKNGSSGDLRPERDILEEILFLSREISINKSKRREKDAFLDPGAFVDLIRRLEELGSEVAHNGTPLMVELLRDIYRPLEYMVERTELPSTVREELFHRLSYIRRSFIDAPLEKPKAKKV